MSRGIGRPDDSVKVEVTGIAIYAKSPRWNVGCAQYVLGAGTGPTGKFLCA